MILKQLCAAFLKVFLVFTKLTLKDFAGEVRRGPTTLHFNDSSLFFIGYNRAFATLRLCQTDGTCVPQTSCRLRSRHHQRAPRQPGGATWLERSSRRTGCRERPPSKRETPVSSPAHKLNHQRCRSDVWKHLFIQLLFIYQLLQIDAVTSNT